MLAVRLEPTQPPSSCSDGSRTEGLELSAAWAPRRLGTVGDASNIPGMPKMAASLSVSFYKQTKAERGTLGKEEEEEPTFVKGGRPHHKGPLCRHRIRNLGALDKHTVNKHPAPVGRWFIPVFSGLHFIHQLVQILSKYACQGSCSEQISQGSSNACFSTKAYSRQATGARHL